MTDLLIPTSTIEGMRQRSASRTKAVPVDLGSRIASLRRERGMTQAELGARIGISRRMVVHYEAEGGNPPGNLLPRIADALGVTIDELFGRSATTRSKPPLNLRLWRQFQQAERLAPKERQALLRLLNALVRGRGDGRRS